jgi:hypothetical protein
VPHSGSWRGASPPTQASPPARSPIHSNCRSSNEVATRRASDPHGSELGDGVPAHVWSGGGNAAASTAAATGRRAGAGSAPPPAALPRPPPAPRAGPAEMAAPRRSEAGPDLGPEAFPGEAEPEERVECGSCGRKFAPKALERHSKVCAKVFCSKRPAFNTVEQRAVADAAAISSGGGGGGGFAARGKAGARQAGRLGGGGAGSSSKAKWLKQSEQLRAAMRAARGGEDDGSGRAAGAPDEEDDR